jgi:pimeloyl-ACP methyl ester carboxylesterase
VNRLALINPLLHYHRHFIDQKPDEWQHGYLTPDAAAALARDGYLPHSASARHGRALLNEIFHLRPDRMLGAVTAPTMIVHGTADTVIPVAWSKQAAPAFGNRGAQPVLRTPKVSVLRGEAHWRPKTTYSACSPPSPSATTNEPPLTRAKPPSKDSSSG